MLAIQWPQYYAFERQAFEAKLQCVENAVRRSLEPDPADAGAGAVAVAAMPADALREIVERSVERCIEFDIDRAPDLAAYVALGLALRAEAVDPIPGWIAAWLNRGDADGPVKMAYIEATLADLGKTDKRLQRVTTRIAKARAAAAR